MANVTLIHPPLGFPGGDGELVDGQPQRYVPLGLTYLASALQAAGHIPYIIDTNAQAIPSLRALIRTQQSDLVGIYTNSFNLRQVRATVKQVRDIGKVPIVLGGPHVTYRPETIAWAGADFAICGDGEHALVQLVTALTTNRPLEGVDGLAKLNQNDEVAANPPALIKDLDKLPLPARELLPRDPYHVPTETGAMTTLVTARGCPFRCIFCALPNHPHYRARNPLKAAEEIRKLEADGYTYVDIHDPTFTWKKERVQTFCEDLLAHHSKIRWGCETRADCVSADLLKLMKRAGCTNVRFGVESGNEQVRNEIIGKRIADDEIIEAVRISHEVGLETMAFFVLGHPGETRGQMLDSLRFAKSLKPTYADFNLSVPIVGSRLYKQLTQAGKLPADIWERIADGKAPIPYYVPDGVTLQEMVALRSRAYRMQYLNLRTVYRQLRAIRRPTDLLARAKAGLKILSTVHRKKPIIW